MPLLGPRPAPNLRGALDRAERMLLGTRAACGGSPVTAGCGGGGSTRPVSATGSACSITRRPATTSASWCAIGARARPRRACDCSRGVARSTSPGARRGTGRSGPPRDPEVRARVQPRGSPPRPSSGRHLSGGQISGITSRLLRRNTLKSARSTVSTLWRGWISLIRTRQRSARSG